MNPSAMRFQHRSLHCRACWNVSLKGTLRSYHAINTTVPSTDWQRRSRFIDALASRRAFSSNATPSKAKGKGGPQQLPEAGSAAADLRILRGLVKHLWPPGDTAIKVRVTIALACLVGGKALNVYVPILFKYLVDALSPIAQAAQGAVPSVETVVVAILIGYGVARLTSVLSQELRNALFGLVAQRAIRDTARTTFEHLHQLPVSFHLERHTGALVRAIDRGTKAINQVLSSVVFHVVPTILEIGLVAGLLGYMHGIEFAVGTIATMIAYTAFTFSTTSWRTKFRKQMNAADNQAANTATDSLLNFEAVKLYGNSKLETKAYDRALAKYESSAVSASTSLAFLNAGQSAIISIGLTAMMYMATNGVLHGTMTVGDLVMVNGLILQLSVPLNFLGMVYRETKQSLIDMDVLLRLRASRTEEESTSRTIASSAATTAQDARQLLIDPTVGASIDFRDVHFAYDPQRPILNGLTFHIPAGKTAAFVGPSGSGKSTIARLILRFHSPQSGTIKINDLDIRDLALESLRSAVGVVPQDAMLFDNSIKHNIIYGDPDADDIALNAALKASSLDDLIKRLPNGLETRVGERGLLISGGEKQRVLIARLFLKDPPIAVFDEATSSLDAATEAKITSSISSFLEATTHSRTAVFIAHRLRSVCNCDIIFVLDKGRVVESGSHEQLLSEGGIYADLWSRQVEDFDGNGNV